MEIVNIHHNNSVTFRNSFRSTAGSKLYKYQQEKLIGYMKTRNYSGFSNQDNYSSLKSHLKYFCRGPFTDNAVSDILEYIENNLLIDKRIQKRKKAILFVIIEALQNIARHQIATHNDSPGIRGLFTIQEDGECFVLTTANVIRNDKIQDIKSKLEIINEKKVNGQLKHYYLNGLKNGTLSCKGGAGLGLIAMALKTSRKVVFNFKQINDDYAVFYFSIIFPFSPSDSKIKDAYYLASIMKMYDTVC